MAQQAPTRLFNVLGFAIWGDLHPLTMYKSHRGNMIWFAKTWPKKPPSPLQLNQREAFRDAVDAWNQLPANARNQWRTAAARASLCATGFNLWMHWQLTGDDQAIATLERQTGTTLLP